jgi:hypothetical protein
VLVCVVIRVMSNDSEEVNFVYRVPRGSFVQVSAAFRQVTMYSDEPSFNFWEMSGHAEEVNLEYRAQHRDLVQMSC